MAFVVEDFKKVVLLGLALPRAQPHHTFPGSPIVISSVNSTMGVQIFHITLDKWDADLVWASGQNHLLAFTTWASFQGLVRRISSTSSERRGAALSQSSKK